MTNSTAEANGRALKAIAIADLLQAKGVDAETAEKLDDSGRRAAAALVGKPVASDETWKIVVAILRLREDLTPVDPFEGLPR